MSPYNYASNNPVAKIDLWGLQGAWAIECGPMLQQYSIQHTGKRIPTIQDAIEHSDNPVKQQQIDNLFEIGMMGLTGVVGEALMEIRAVSQVFSKIDDALSGLFKSSDDFVAKGISGRSFTSNELTKIVETTGDDAVVNLYRGVSGSEGGKGALFLTTDEAYATAYATEKGTEVMSVQVSKSGYNYLVNEGIIETKTGALFNEAGKQIASGTETVIYNQQLKDIILNASKVE